MADPIYISPSAKLEPKYTPWWTTGINSLLNQIYQKVVGEPINSVLNPNDQEALGNALGMFGQGGPGAVSSQAMLPQTTKAVGKGIQQLADKLQGKLGHPFISFGDNKKGNLTTYNEYSAPTQDNLINGQRVKQEYPPLLDRIILAAKQVQDPDAYNYVGAIGNYPWDVYSKLTGRKSRIGGLASQTPWGTKIDIIEPQYSFKLMDTLAHEIEHSKQQFETPGIFRDYPSKLIELADKAGVPLSTIPEYMNHPSEVAARTAGKKSTENWLGFKNAIGDIKNPNSNYKVEELTIDKLMNTLAQYYITEMSKNPIYYNDNYGILKHPNPAIKLLDHGVGLFDKFPQSSEDFPEFVYESVPGTLGKNDPHYRLMKRILENDPQVPLDKKIINAIAYQY